MNWHVFVKHATSNRIAALVNSPYNALKTRFLFLLNKCHSNNNLKKEKEK